VSPGPRVSLSPPPPAPLSVLPLLEELQALARTGLNYSESAYDRERYERILGLVARYYGVALELPPEEVRRRLSRELGYITPKVGAEAAVFDPDGRILLVRRADDGLWCLPCGWVEPNESPEEAAVREAREETGLIVEVRRLVGVFTRKPDRGYGPHSAIAVAYLCEVVGGTPRPSHETPEVAYRRIADVAGWHEMHQTYAEAAQAVWKAETRRT
jgi:ADP-ribose pyrophosphatase YjhB (NUDIX family)